MTLCDSFLISIETPLLDLRPRFAWCRPSVDEAGCRYCIGRSWGYDTPGADCDRSGHTSGAGDRSRNTAARRFMDTHRGDTGDAHRAAEHLLGSGRSVDLSPVGNPRCRAGTARTWRLVGRCLPFWMEAHRPSRSQELGFRTSFGLVLTYSKRVFLPSDMVCATTPSGVVPRPGCLHNVRNEQRG